MTHIGTKDGNKEEERVKHCMEIEEINVNFVRPQRGSSTSNKYNILRFLHQSEVKTTLNILHQGKLVNAWEIFLLDVFTCIEYLRRREIVPC